jgi:hypothetical protein
MTTYVTDHTRAVLAAGLAWLYDTVQPDDALLQANGGPACRVGDRRYSFTPVGFDGGPVLVIDVAKPVYDYTRNSPRLTNPLGGPAEMDAHADLLTELGYPPVTSWNGQSVSETGSFLLPGRAHPSLTAATERYRAGCPKHDTVFCGWQGRTADERACTWYRDHYARVVQPTWPAAPAPAEAEANLTKQT